MTDPAEIRAEGRRLLLSLEAASMVGQRAAIRRDMSFFLIDHADVLLADPAPVDADDDELLRTLQDAIVVAAADLAPAPVGLTEDEQEAVGFFRWNAFPGTRMAIVLAALDRLSAAPVDDLEREALERIIVAMERVTPCPWCSEDNNPSECPTAIARNALAVPLSPSVDPEEEP